MLTEKILINQIHDSSCAQLIAIYGVYLTFLNLFYMYTVHIYYQYFHLNYGGVTPSIVLKL